MTREEVANVLKTYIGKRPNITFDDGVVQTVEVSCVDDEGFLHSGHDGGGPQAFWTRFEAVTLIEP